MSVKRITHKGVQVLYADYRDNPKPEQQIQCLDEIAKTLNTSPNGELILSNFEGVSVGPEFMTQVKERSAKNRGKIRRQALLGITGLKNVLLQGYISFTGMKEIKTFNNEAEALDWLVS